MRRFTSFLSCIFLASALISCTPLKQRMLGAGNLIKPGDKIGEMTVEQGEPTLPYPLLWQFCEYMPDQHEPVESSIDCSVPRLSGMNIQFGWIATESKLDSNWEALTWQLSIDGHTIDLEAFKQTEITYPVHQENNKSRQWIIVLKDLSPGELAERALQAILSDPEFVFRGEADPANVKPGEPYRISDVELASRLAFFLWSTSPDDELLAVAERGRVLSTAAFHVGGRLLATDGAGTITVLEPGGQTLARGLGFVWQVGSRVSGTEIERLADYMARAILSLIQDEKPPAEFAQLFGVHLLGQIGYRHRVLLSMS